MNFKIDEMIADDWPQVSAIYLAGIKTNIATFQSDAPTWEEWDSSHTKLCRLVARSEANVMGWAALSPVSSRCVYSGVAEVSIYVDEKYRGQEIGKVLLEALIKESEEKGFWTLQSVVIKENTPSLNLHRKCGFREVGVRERLGKMNTGRWHDVVFLEKRSNLAG